MEVWARKQSFIPREGNLRVVCLGGSVTYGFPMPAEGAYPHVLRSTLKELYPDSVPQIISMGLLNGNVERLRSALDEVLDLQPHLVVLEVGCMESLSRWEVREGRPSAYLNQHTGSPPPLDRSVMEGRSLPEFESQLSDKIKEMVETLTDKKIKVIMLYPGVNIRARPLHDRSTEQTPSHIQTQVSQLMHMVEKAQDDEGIVMKCLDRVIELTPKSPSFHYVHAQYLEKFGRHKEARKSYQQAVNLDHQPLRPRDQLREKIKALAKSLDVPLVDGQEVANSMSEVGASGYGQYFDYLHPQRELHLIYARMILGYMGVREASKDLEFGKILSKDWSWKDRVWSEVWRLSGRALYFCGENASARRLFQRSLEHNSQNMSSMISLGSLLMLEGEKNVALALLKKVLENENWKFLPYQEKILLAEVLAMVGEEESLKVILDENEKYSKDVRWSSVFAYKYIAEGKDDLAIPFFRKALEVSPLHPLLLRGLEVSYLRSQRWVDYMDWLKERLVEKRSRAKVMSLLKVLEKESIDKPELARTGIELIRLFLGLENKREILPWLTLARLYANLEQYHRSIEALERTLLLSSAYNLPLNQEMIRSHLEELRSGKNPFQSEPDPSLSPQTSDDGVEEPEGQPFEDQESSTKGVVEPESSRQ